MRFELLEELGRGATGVVFKARDRETGDTVAVKRLFGARVPQREVLLARKITHPNVCRVYDLYREGETAFISMEYVNGSQLKGPLAYEDAIPIALQICDGLEAAHRQGIVHRDLKPANVLVARDGTVKIMDFGLAVRTGPDATIGHGMAGTPGYVAPEILAGAEPDERTDIYALGLVLTELGLESEAGGCLEADPRKRFRSVGEVRDALTGRKRQPKWVRPVLVASVVLIVIAGAFVLSMPGTENITRKSEPAASSPAPTTIVPPVPVAADKRPALAILVDGELQQPLTTALARIEKFKLVERPELDRVLDELKLQRTDAVDPLTAQKIGRIVGAEYLVFGSEQAFGAEVRASARLVRTETGEIVGAETETGTTTQISAIAEKLANRLAK